MLRVKRLGAGEQVGIFMRQLSTGSTAARIEIIPAYASMPSSSIRPKVAAMHPFKSNRLLYLAVASSALGSLSGVARAGSPCDLVTRGEATQLLGISAGKKLARHADHGLSGCVIRAVSGGHDRDSLELGIATDSRTRPSRQHTDDERGDEVPSMHGEPWYEVSVPDARHPNDRRLVIHRDRTSLTLDLHSSHQTDARRAFESVWYKIAERLPADER
jgi:hypothetical protein